MRLRLKSLLIISLFVILYAIYYWIVPIVVNIGGRVSSIENIAKKQFGVQIELKNPKLKMGLTPAIWLESSSFKIVEKKSSPFSIVNPKIKIQLIPLIFGKVKIAYFSCDKVDADLRIDKESRFYIGNYLIINSSNPIVSIENSKLNFNSYEIKLNDEYENKNILLKGEYFNLEQYNPKKYIKFSTDSQLTINNHNSVINIDVGFKLPLKKSFDANEMVFDGTVTNLNLGDLSPYIRKITKNNIQKTQGILNIEAGSDSLTRKTKQITTKLVIQDLLIQGKDNFYSINYPNKIIISIVGDISKNRLTLHKLQILSKNINLNIAGKISKIDTKNPLLDLSVLLNKSKIEDFVAFFPNKNFKDVNVNFVALKKYGYYGDIEGKLSIKGKTNRPKLTGSFLSTNGYVIKPLNIPKATVKLNFLGEQLYLDVLVPTGKNDKVSVKGTVGLYDNGDANLDVASTQNIDLETTEFILNPIHEMFYFEIGPVPVMQLKGLGHINLKIRGNPLNPHLFGALKFRNTTASFNGIDILLKNGEGKLDFEDTNTHFLTKKAFLNGTPINIDGKCSLLGILDFGVTANGQNLDFLIKSLKNSPMLAEIEKMLPPIDKATGKIDANIKLKGTVKTIDEFDFGKNVFASGNLKLHGNNIIISGLKAPLKGLSGDIEFEKASSKLDLYTVIDKSKIHIKGKVKNDDADFEIIGSLKNNPFNFSGKIKNIFKGNQIVNAKFVSDNFDVSAIKNLISYPFISDSAKKYLNEISNPTGHVNLKASIKNNVLNSKIKLHDLSFIYSNLKIPIRIFSGSIELNNDKLMLYKVNSEADSMPILIDGLITNIFKTPNFNIYINSKPVQKFIEQYINKNATYPLKVKGDIIYTTRIHGTKDSFNAKTEVNLQQDANIYYMGSTLGDVNNPIRIYLDTNIAKNSIYVNNFQYDKLISSQNDKEFISAQLSAKGGINVNKNNINLHNFRIKTQNPTDAKIFNILFKKPMVKQGLFTSNILLNGPIASPMMLGNLNFTGIDIPLLDTTIKDISLDFNGSNIDIKTKGEIFSNNIVVFANMQNKLTPPYRLSNVDIYLGNLDINEIIKSLNKLQIESDMHKLAEQKPEFDIRDLVIKNAKLKADSVLVKNIYAKNLTADFSLSDKLLFSLDNFKFEVADGNVNGNFKYNLLNSNSDLELHVDNVNANSMSDALFDLPNQVYGSLTGQVELTCNGNTHKTCMDTLSGGGGFRIADGRMPKLGSLEYLLKAANLVKSGITGITMNSIIDFVTPLKTGNFENINGSFAIKSGLADSIQIFSKGKDLSIFLTGTYNFSTLVADMDVFGRLSKRISTVLGPIGNTSLNTLFNTIPGLNLDTTNNPEFLKNLNKIPGFELNDKKFRIFSAEIYGDINGEHYVQSFKWVE